MHGGERSQLGWLCALEECKRHVQAGDLEICLPALLHPSRRTRELCGMRRILHLRCPQQWLAHPSTEIQPFPPALPVLQGRKLLSKLLRVLTQAAWSDGLGVIAATLLWRCCVELYTSVVPVCCCNLI